MGRAATAAPVSNIDPADGTSGACVVWRGGASRLGALVTWGREQEREFSSAEIDWAGLNGSSWLAWAVRGVGHGGGLVAKGRKLCGFIMKKTVAKTNKGLARASPALLPPVGRGAQKLAYPAGERGEILKLSPLSRVWTYTCHTLDPASGMLNARASLWCLSVTVPAVTLRATRSPVCRPSAGHPSWFLWPPSRLPPDLPSPTSP